jgi:bacterial/archaeal transporter family-2 protein
MRCLPDSIQVVLNIHKETGKKKIIVFGYGIKSACVEICCTVLYFAGLSRSLSTFSNTKTLFMQSKWMFIIVAFMLGAILPIQGAINAKLAKTVASPVMAAFISFAVGTMALFLYLVLSRQANWHAVSIKNTSWWIWTGGLLGTFFVAGITVLLPRLGVALAFGLVIAGQMAAAVIFDQFGFLGVAIREISAGKIAGALLLIAGVVLIRKF